MKTLKFSLFCAIALVFVVGVNVTMVHAQGTLHDTWYKANMKSEYTRGWLTGNEGTLVKARPSLNYYFKVCDEKAISDCGAVDYDIVLAIADFDGDGIFEADEVFDVTLATCGPDETSFVFKVDIADALDLDDDPETLEVFNQDANGRVGGENNNKLSSRGCFWTADNAATDLDPDITGRKCRFNANPIATDDLPFTPQDLVDEGVISDVSDLNCTTTLFANAGPDQTVEINDLVTLDGSGSLPTGGTFAWVLTVTPPGSTAALSGAGTANPTFTPDGEGTYTVELTYTVGEDSDTDTVVVTGGPDIPQVQADAGPDLTVQAAGQKAYPVGSGTPPDSLVCDWVITAKPPGSSASFELGYADACATILQTDLEGTYTLELTYTYGDSSDTDTMVVTAGSDVRADAGPDQNVLAGSTIVYLRGADSSPFAEDPNMPGSFSWVFLERPEDSDADLSQPTSVGPFFNADVAGTYTVELTYTVGPNSDTDTVTVTAEDRQ